MDHAGLTDVGLKRSHNEDAFLVDPARHLFVVADGMGGHASGEVASRIAVEEVERAYVTPRPEDWDTPTRLAEAVGAANAAIQARAAADAATRGMGTTIVALRFEGDRACIAHVGDSRAYRFRDGALTQVTEDHSLLEEYRRTGALSEEEVESFPFKNVILRALGLREEVEVDVACHPTRPDDVWLLCSDGLSGMLSDPDMARIVAAAGDDLDAAAQALVDAANAAGGADNITVVLARPPRG